VGDREAHWQGWPTEYRGGDTVSYYSE